MELVLYASLMWHLFYGIADLNRFFTVIRFPCTYFTYLGFAAFCTKLKRSRVRIIYQLMIIYIKDRIAIFNIFNRI